MTEVTNSYNNKENNNKKNYYKDTQ